jgi:ABC-type antimicrobial peptide transport system permease subunit
VLATLLAEVGLYCVMALTVTRWTREIGLRTALGARRGAPLWMVIKDAFGLPGIGLALGIPGAYLLSRSVSSQLFGVAGADLGTAALVPARRASTIDPIQALRHE